MPRFAIAPLGVTTEGSTKGWKCYLKKLQYGWNVKPRLEPESRNAAIRVQGNRPVDAVLLSESTLRLLGGRAGARPPLTHDVSAERGITRAGAARPRWRQPTAMCAPSPPLPPPVDPLILKILPRPLTSPFPDFFPQRRMPRALFSQVDEWGRFQPRKFMEKVFFFTF